jgi:hypothetical protein
MDRPYYPARQALPLPAFAPLALNNPLQKERPSGDVAENKQAEMPTFRHPVILLINQGLPRVYKR